MNVRFFCLILAVCFWGNIFAQNTTDARKDKLTGNVRLVQTESYEAKRGSSEPVKSIHLETFITKYSREGVKEGIDYVSGTGTLTYQATYKRDAYGNIILETILDPKNQALGKTLYAYNDKNLPTEEYIFSGYNELENVVYYHYDRQNNCVEKIYTDEERNTTEIHLLTYDSQNRLTNIQVNTANGKKKTDISFEYDAMRNPIATNTFDYTQADVRLKADIFEYTYDNYGNWTKRIQYRLEKENLIPYHICERKIEYYQ